MHAKKRTTKGDWERGSEKARTNTNEVRAATMQATGACTSEMPRPKWFTSVGELGITYDTTNEAQALSPPCNSRSNSRHHDHALHSLLLTNLHGTTRQHTQPRHHHIAQHTRTTTAMPSTIANDTNEAHALSPPHNSGSNSRHHDHVLHSLLLTDTRDTTPQHRQPQQHHTTQHIRITTAMPPAHDMHNSTHEVRRDATPDITRHQLHTLPPHLQSTCEG